MDGTTRFSSRRVGLVRRVPRLGLTGDRAQLRLEVLDDNEAKQLMDLVDDGIRIASSPSNGLSMNKTRTADLRSCNSDGELKPKPNPDRVRLILEPVGSGRSSHVRMGW